MLRRTGGRELAVEGLELLREDTEPPDECATLYELDTEEWYPLGKLETALVLYADGKDWGCI